MEATLGGFERCLVSSVFRIFPVSSTNLWELASMTSLAQLSRPVKTTERASNASALRQRESGIEWSHLEKITKLKCSKQSKKADEKSIL